MVTKNKTEKYGMVEKRTKFSLLYVSGMWWHDDVLGAKKHHSWGLMHLSQRKMECQHSCLEHTVN